MAAGEHWEWRGFGRIDQALEDRIRGLSPLLDDEWQVTDYYLWAPDCPVNVKLRGNDLKLKRFLAASQGLERWLEDEAEVFPFPLAPVLVAELARILAVDLPQKPQAALTQPSLLALLFSSTPPVQLIAVAKSRWLYHLAAVDSSRPGPPVLVELTEISAPEQLTTVALEHPQIEAVQAALDHLDISASALLPRNYLQVLPLWAKGQRLFDQD